MIDLHTYIIVRLIDAGADVRKFEPNGFHRAISAGVIRVPADTNKVMLTARGKKISAVSPVHITYDDENGVFDLPSHDELSEELGMYIPESVYSDLVLAGKYASLRDTERYMRTINHQFHVLHQTDNRIMPILDDILSTVGEYRQACAEVAEKENECCAALLANFCIVPIARQVQAVTDFAKFVSAFIEPLRDAEIEAFNTTVDMLIEYGADPVLFDAIVVARMKYTSRTK